MQNAEENGTTGTPKQTMTMKEALANSGTNSSESARIDPDLETLSALDMDGQNPLFEYATG